MSARILPLPARGVNRLEGGPGCAPVIQRYSLRGMKGPGFAVFIAYTMLSATAAPARAEWVIREDGIGPAKPGMTLSELNAAAGIGWCLFL